MKFMIGEKRCTNCNEVKSIDMFFLRNKKKDPAPRPECKSCSNKQQRKYRKTDAGKDVMKKHYINKKERHSLYNSEYCRKKKKAHAKVGYAIKAGKIKRTNKCSKCSREDKTHFHHYAGYEGNNALKVIELCQYCHRKEHQ